MPVQPSLSPAAGGGGLPVTGASIPTAVGLGAALLGVGAGLCFAVRRRRIDFDA